MAVMKSGFWSCDGRVINLVLYVLEFPRVEAVAADLIYVESSIELRLPSSRSSLCEGSLF